MLFYCCQNCFGESRAERERHPRPVCIGGLSECLRDQETHIKVLDYAEFGNLILQADSLLSGTVTAGESLGFWPVSTAQPGDILWGQDLGFERFPGVAIGRLIAIETSHGEKVFLLAATTWFAGKLSHGSLRSGGIPMSWDIGEMVEVPVCMIDFGGVSLAVLARGTDMKSIRKCNRIQRPDNIVSFEYCRECSLSRVFPVDGPLDSIFLDRCITAMRSLSQDLGENIYKVNRNRFHLPLIRPRSAGVPSNFEVRALPIVTDFCDPQ